VTEMWYCNVVVHVRLSLEYSHLIKVASEGRSGDTETFSCICHLNKQRTSSCKF
jgi:hypothetical protein